MTCRFCAQNCIRKGFTKTIRRYYCKACNRFQQAVYCNMRFDEQAEYRIVAHVKSAFSIRDTARLTGFAPSSIIKVIKRMASRIKPVIIENAGGTFEIDEMRIPVAGRTDVYLTYALNRATSKIVSFAIGKRTIEIIRSVTKSVISTNPSKVCTDGLNLYPGLIGKKKHQVSKYQTVHIERMNATLRAHIKRFSESGLSYTRSVPMADACMRIYLWG